MTSPSPDGLEQDAADPWWRAPIAALGAFGLVLAFYLWLRPDHGAFYNHFVWLADAFLHGQTSIPWPVDGNAYFQDVYPILDRAGAQTGFALVPFPPLPALVLAPFVALFGMSTDQALIAVFLGAAGAIIAFALSGTILSSLPKRVLLALFFALGTDMWYSAAIGTTWFFAHLVAVPLALGAIWIALASDHGDDAVRRPALDPRTLLAAPRALLDRRMLLAGVLLGLAAASRLPVALGLPFLFVVGSGQSWLTRVVSASLGVALPVAAMLIYNLVSSGQLVHPGYEYLYLREASGYPDLHYHPTWAIEDIRYAIEHLGSMLFGAPDMAPACAPGLTPGLFTRDCPLILPQTVGMGLLYTSPAWLLGLLPIIRRSRRGLAAGVAVAAIALFDLAHFSQGWVQFGQRFALDWAPFGLVLLALALAGRSRAVAVTAVALVAVSIAITAWGVWWGVQLGW